MVLYLSDGASIAPMPEAANRHAAETVVALVGGSPAAVAQFRSGLSSAAGLRMVVAGTLEEAVLGDAPGVLHAVVCAVDPDDSRSLSLLGRVRSARGMAGAPVIALVPAPSPLARQQCLEAGADGCLAESADPDAVIECIRAHIAVARAGDERDRAVRSLVAAQEELSRRTAEIEAANRHIVAMGELLGQESQEQRDRLAEVAALGARLGHAQDLDEVLDQSLHLARRFTDADAGSVWLVEPQGLRLAYTQNDTLQSRLGPGARLPLADLVIPADSASIAGHVAVTGKPLRIDDVHALGEGVPYRFRSEVDLRTGYTTHSMLVAPLTDARDAVVGVLQLINARGHGMGHAASARFSRADEAALELFAGMASLALGRARLVRGSIMRTIATAEMRDPTETGAHVQRVAECSVAMFDRWAARRGMDEVERNRRRDELRIAAMLHDVGKVAIPDSILRKPGKLDDAEYRRIQTHSVLGGRLFSDIATPYDEASRDVAVHHHERWDGTGYPGRMTAPEIARLPIELECLPSAEPLGGEQIPLFARIVAVADVYDALTSRRSYKEPWPDERVAEFLRDQSGRHFDPELVEIALDLLGYFRSVRSRFSSDGS